MSIIRLKPLALAKAVAAGQEDLPTKWQSATYAPGFPIEPLPHPEETLVPREIDYPIAVNANIQPRAGYGLMPFSSLLLAYENVSETRIPVQVILRELTGFRPRLVDKTGSQIFDHPCNWVTLTPDRVTPFDIWLTRFLKCMYIFDAGAMYIERDHGNLAGLRYVDGSTLFIIVNEHGDVPLPDEVSNDPKVQRRYITRAQEWARRGLSLPTETPAYTQVIKGTPFGWYSQNDIWYKPRSRRVNAPYGESYIEQTWAWVLVIANITGFELAHYREGNMPEGWWESPPDWSLERLAAFEVANNLRMSSSPAERMRSRFYPFGFKWHETKKAEWPEKLYLQARDNILNAVGLPPAELGKMPGMGLGGKGFGEIMQSSLFRNGLMPPKAYVEGFINEQLVRFGVTDVQFELALPVETVDPQKLADSVVKQFSVGLISINDALAQLGLKPVEGGNLHMVVAGGSVIVLEDYLAGKRDAPAGQPPAPGAPPAQIEPEGTAAPTDVQRAKDILMRTDENRSVTVDGAKTFPMSFVAKLDHPKLVAGRFAPKGAIDSAGAMALGRQLGVDFNQVSPHEFQLGLNEEQEHSETVGGDITVMARIALDHLREDPQYYTHLGKRYSVRSVDGKWQVWNIDKDEPVGKPHETKEQADAHRGALYANVSDARMGKVDITSHDGAMIAVMIPPEVSAKLRAVADGLGLPQDAEMELAENMHVTLAFLPDFERAQSAGDAISEACKNVASRFAPLSGKVQGYGMFNGEDGRHVLFALLDAPDLPVIRQSICDALDECGVQYARDHGFVPHITLSYFTDDWQIPEGFAVPDIACSIDGVTFALGDKRNVAKFSKTAVSKARTPFGYVATSTNAIVLTKADLAKHCGTCPEDEEYYQAPVSREADFSFPTDNHANDVEIVAMCPEGLPCKPALWKPEGGEVEELRDRVGGPMYPREEAVYLIDRSLGFYLVPVAYVAELDGEEGAVIFYTHDHLPAKEPEEYDPIWVERAGILDYAISQIDRHFNHNYFTHPDDEKRLILFDNGLSCPTDPDIFADSLFSDFMGTKPLQAESIAAMQRCYNDAATWRDVKDLIGEQATDKVRLCIEHMIKWKAVHDPSAE